MPSDPPAWIRTAEAKAGQMKGDPLRAREARIGAAERAFMEASTAAEYAVVRDYLRGVTAADVGHHRTPVGVASTMISANAAFFASQSVPAGEEQKIWIRLALRDFGELPEQALDSVTTLKVASLAQAIVMMAWRLWPLRDDPD